MPKTAATWLRTVHMYSFCRAYDIANFQRDEIQKPLRPHVAGSFPGPRRIRYLWYETIYNVSFWDQFSIARVFVLVRNSQLASREVGIDWKCDMFTVDEVK